MPRIKGKFCPLTDELGNDERFIINSTDLDKLMYVLVMYTCHMTYHKAPSDARFYKIRYGLRAKLVQIKGSLERLRGLYKGLSWVDGKVSLLNSATYISKPVQKGVEVEEKRSRREVEVEKESAAAPDPSKQISLKDIDLKGQSEGVKHKVFNWIVDIFKNRGWKTEPEYVKRAFKLICEEVQNYNPKDFYPYFRKTAENYISKKSELFAADARIARGQEKKIGVTVGGMAV